MIRHIYTNLARHAKARLTHPQNRDRITMIIIIIIIIIILITIVIPQRQENTGDSPVWG